MTPSRAKTRTTAAKSFLRISPMSMSMSISTSDCQWKLPGPIAYQRSRMAGLDPLITQSSSRLPEPKVPDT
jgi:hypothetical protein